MSPEPPASHESASGAPLYVRLSARPTRVGVFVPLAENMPWLKTFEMALAGQSRLWGGSGNLLFPVTDDLADNELFWALADRLDADYFAIASFSHRNLGEANPTWLAEWRTNQREAMAKNTPPELDAKQWLEQIDRELERVVDDPVLWWKPADSFLELLERRLAPFHHDRQTRWLHTVPVNDPKALQTGQARTYPFSDIEALDGWPAAIANPEVALDDVHKLLVTAELGRLPSGLVSGITATTATKIEPWPIGDEVAWHEAFFRSVRDQRTLPWSLANLGLGVFRSGRWGRDHPVIVTGDTPWDFALFLALQRWRGGVAWLPQSLMNSEGYLMRVGNSLSDAQNLSEREVEVVTTSDVTYRDEAMKKLKAVPGWRLPVEAADWRDVLPDHPHRLLEMDHPGRPEPIPTFQGATVELPTPIPTLATTSPGRRLRWIIDARAHGWAPVRHGALGDHIIDQPGFTTEYARTGRGTASYTSAGTFTFLNDSYEASTERPLLRPSRLVEEMDVALSASGWRCQASDKGTYASRSADLFGGFRRLAEGLLDVDVRAVVEAFRDKGKDALGRKAGGRRYLSLVDIAKVVGDRAKAESVCQDLRDRRVISHGLFLKCSDCRAGSWYPLDDVTGDFKCRRCRTVQTVTPYGWLGTPEPVWHYELSEVVWQFLEHDGELPVLSVHELFEPPPRGDEDIEVAFEIEVFSPDGTKSETDIAVRDDFGRLWLGEATKADQFERTAAKETVRLARLKDIADALAARGIIIASAQAFKPKTLERATQAFAGPWPTMRVNENVRIKP